MFRQVHPLWVPFYHAFGEPTPSQCSGRWHREGEGYAQYTSLSASGAWAELIRSEHIRGNHRSAEYMRNLWHAFVDEMEIADLSSFDKYEAAGLDPGVAVGPHDRSQALADELRAAGFRGVLSPSAAIRDVVNLTLFGPRVELPTREGVDVHPNPRPGLFVPCELVADGGSPPNDLLTEAIHEGEPHLGLDLWRNR